MRKSVVIAVVLTAVLCVSAAWCQGPPPGGPGGPGGPGMRMMNRPCPVTATAPPGIGMLGHLAQALQLTDDQVTKIKDIVSQCDQSMRPLMQKVGDTCKALREALMAETLDAVQVKDLATKAEKAEADVVTANIDAWTKVRAVLTQDQLAKLAQTMAPPQGPPAGPPPPGGPAGGPDGPPPGPPPAE